MHHHFLLASNITEAFPVNVNAKLSTMLIAPPLFCFIALENHL